MQELDIFDKNIIKGKLLKYHKKLPNGCWEWTRSVGSHGYGNIRVNCQGELTHRLSMRLFKPDEYNNALMVCHRCNNRLCVNPDHLYMGSYEDNYRDAKNDGKALDNGNSKKTKCLRGHEFSIENTYLYRGKRTCKECRRNAGRIADLYRKPKEQR